MDSAALSALSPVDGRYRKAADGAARRAVGKRPDPRTNPHRSRLAAGAGRIRAASPRPAAAPTPCGSWPRAWRSNPAKTLPTAVKAIEARINHDVKAVEYFVREKLTQSGATPATLELVHFGCTSEDINNLAYARMLRAARTAAVRPSSRKLIERLRGFAHEHAALPMLSRTHGQTASPTTLGKEFANVVARLRRARDASRQGRDPRQVEWRGRQLQRARRRAAQGRLAGGEPPVRRVAGLRLERILHADRAARLDRRILRRARRHQHHPHRLRARHLGLHLARIPAPARGRRRSRLVDHAAQGQSDRFRERRRQSRHRQCTAASFRRANCPSPAGSAISPIRPCCAMSAWHWRTAWSPGIHCSAASARSPPTPEVIAADIDTAYEVLGEALQTALRAAGVPNGYELLKDFTRGADVDAAGLAAFIDKLPLPLPTAHDSSHSRRPNTSASQRRWRARSESVLRLRSGFP